MLLCISSHDRSSGSTHDFGYNLNTRVNLRLDNEGHTDPKIKLSKISFFNSRYNISYALENNIIRYSNSAEWKNITIPDGIYTFSNLTTLISSQITALEDDPDNIKITYNENTAKSEVVLSSDYQLDLSYAGSPTVIFGSSALLNSNGKHISANRADILNGVDHVVIRSNIVRNAIYGKTYQQVLGTFTPAFAPNQHVVIEFDDVLHDCNNYSLDQLTFKLTDQNNRDWDLNGEDVLIEFHLVSSS